MKAHRTSVPVFKHAELVEPGNEILDVNVAPALRARLAHILLSFTGTVSRFLRGGSPRLFHYRAEKEAHSLHLTRMKATRANHDFFR